MKNRDKSRQGIATNRDTQSRHHKFPTVSGPSATLIQELIRLIGEAVAFDDQEFLPPLGLLWPDPEGFFRTIQSDLVAAGLKIFQLGEYDPESRTGPALWLRCVVDRSIPADLKEEDIPILYLPGVGKGELRAGPQMRLGFEPLVAIGHCCQRIQQKRTGKEITPEFLMARCKLEFAKDADTRQAYHQASRELMRHPLLALQGKRLRAEDFRKLLHPDIEMEFLRWIDDPDEKIRALQTSSEEADRWKAFCTHCEKNFEFNPEKGSAVNAAQQLAHAKGPFEMLWKRFSDTPSLFPGVVKKLQQGHVHGEMFLDPTHWPLLNQEAEETLRKELERLADKPTVEVRERLVSLEIENVPRRESVWAKLDQAPLAVALEYLCKLAEATKTHLIGDTRHEIFTRYAEYGFKADLALRDALAVKMGPRDRAAIAAIVQTLYLEWAERSAQQLQAVTVNESPPGYRTQKEPKREGSVCWVFVDGLRYDLAVELKQMLQRDAKIPGNAELRDVELKWREAAWPTVTATAKIAALPIAEEFESSKMGKGFLTGIKETGQDTSHPRLKDLLALKGYQVMAEKSISAPGNESDMAYIELGAFDKKGHSLQHDYFTILQQELDALKDNLRELLNAGWAVLQIFTDHGWLYVPGGLPKTDLPKHLVESRWSRCAELEPGSGFQGQTAPWTYDKLVHFAYAPGISCFKGGEYYSHGGLSPQECVIPEMTIYSAIRKVKQPKFVELRWRQLSLTVQCKGEASGCSVELRVSDSEPLAKGQRSIPLSAKGKATLFVEDDEWEGKMVNCVLLDPSGTVLERKPTRVGGENE